MDETDLEILRVLTLTFIRVLDGMQAVVTILANNVAASPHLHAILQEARASAILEVCIDPPDSTENTNNVVRDKALIEINQRLDRAFNIALAFPDKRTAQISWTIAR